MTLGARIKAAVERDSVIATLVGAAAVVLLAATATNGFVRDEGYYFRAAREYFSWFQTLWEKFPELHHFSDATLTRAFGYNIEHPGLVKILSGWTWYVAHSRGTSQATGFRLAAQIITGVGTAFTYLLGARLTSRGVGLLAVVLLFACPHVFYHAHLACFDAPVMALTVVTTYAFWRSLSSRRWIVLAGVAWGLALATKHN
ncbi:MAG: glycosyltransferase family 39 protein, partial [Deltaproteobacteria bacterium]|nr:glycosyltransferase family 39 protein [Deltaproteobacteria bacterium]